MVVGNKERGLARVKSLLKMFGLEKCLYENQELGMTNLNWNLVEERLYEWRKKSFSLINKVYLINIPKVSVIVLIYKV